MAREGTTATVSSLANNYLSVTTGEGTPIVSDCPYTMAIWVNMDDVTSSQTPMSLSQSEDPGKGNGSHFYIATNLWYQPLGSEDSGLANTAISTTTLSTNTWHHCCGALNASGHATVWLDGGGKDTAADVTLSTANCDMLVVGARNSSSAAPTPVDRECNGRYVWPAIWDVELTDAEVSSLAAGASPLMVRPQSLIFFAPMLSGTGGATDIIGGNDLVETGTVGLAANPPLIQPTAQIIPFPPSAGGPTEYTETDTFSGIGTSNLSLALTLSDTFSYTGLGTLAQTHGSLYTQEATPSGVGTSGVVKQVSKPLVHSASASSGITKGVGKVLAQTGIGTSVAQNDLVLSHDADMTGTGTSTVTVQNSIGRLFTYVGTGTVALTRAISLSLNHYANGIAQLVHDGVAEGRTILRSIERAALRLIERLK